MFSSLLPKPKNITIETVKIILPKPNTQSNALLPKLSSQTSETSVQKRSTYPSNGHPSSVEKLFFNPDGSINHSQTLAYASGGSVSVQASYEDTIPLKVRFPKLKHHFPSYTLQNCPDDSLRRCVEETRDVISGLLAKVTGGDEPAGDTLIHKYTSSTFTGSDTKTIQITSLQEDPMLPPKFKLRNNRESQPAPPPPVLKAAPTEKITKEVKDKWHIPSAVSNWKNNQGFTISLDKRVNAASGGAAPTGTNFNFEKFSNLSQALEDADAAARKELEERHNSRRLTAVQSQIRKDKDHDLKQLLEQARSRKRGSAEDESSQKKPRN